MTVALCRIDCQNDLSSSISKINKKSQLFVIREAPQTVLQKLFKAWNITHLVFEKDTDAYARERDAEVVKQAKKAGVEVISKMGRTLYDPDELVKANGGKPTMSITQVQHAGEKLGDVAKPIAAPTSLPDPGDTRINFEPSQPSPNPDFNDIQRDRPDESYDKLSGPNGDFAPPTMKELGLKEATSTLRGGESLALEALDKIIDDADYTATFAKPNTAPTAFNPQSTTLLSPHHHFGSLSVRLFYWRVMDVLSMYPKGKQSKIPANLIGQLLFRDMYFGAQAQLGWSFAQTVGNAQCRFIPWHLPSKVNPKNNLITGSYEIDSEEAEVWFQRWKFGKTGFPWIDAAMRQLRHEGWIHHLARHAVACFLTRGGCYISWERGAEVFEEWLIDHETACNSGNWQWMSCTAFFTQFFRCYSPIAFAKKTDANGDYVRHFVPELKDYPSKYIYEPWRAPIADQKKAKCLIKGDDLGEEGDLKVYPKPMFDFNERRTNCINAIKSAYSVHLYGNSKEVLDCTWRKLFDDEAEGPTEGKKETAMFEGEVESDYGENADIADESHKKKSSPRKSGTQTPQKRKGQGTIDGHFNGTKGKKQKK